MPVTDVSIVSIISRYVKLKPLGPHQVGKCPFHNDHTASLTVTESKNLFKCFGCGAAGDSVDFVKLFKNVGYKEALRIVREKSSDLPEPPKEIKPVHSVWRQIPPEFNPNFQHKEFGMPSKRWVYRDLDGFVIGYDCRFDLPDGSKMVLPYGFFSNGRLKSWRWQGFDAPRPVYNQHELTQGKPVLIVEGCKTAKAGQDLLSEYFTVVTWQGGANGLEKTNFKVLKGLQVYLWPDNDKEARYASKYHAKCGELKPYREQPGNAAMIEIGRSLMEIANSIFWVPNREEWPNKWDLADWENPDKLEVFEYIMQNRKPFKG